MSLALDARFMRAGSDEGIGRWRLYYRPEDLREASWAVGHLVQGCQVRVRERGETIVGPCRASELPDRIDAVLTERG